MKSNLLAPLGAAAVSLVCFISSPAMAGESGVQGSIQADSVPTDQPWTQPARAAFTIDTKGPDSFAVDIAGKVYFPLGTSPSVFGLGELVLHRNSQQKKEQNQLQASGGLHYEWDNFEPAKSRGELWSIYADAKLAYSRKSVYPDKTKPVCIASPAAVLCHVQHVESLRATLDVSPHNGMFETDQRKYRADSAADRSKLPPWIYNLGFVATAFHDSILENTVNPNTGRRITGSVSGTKMTAGFLLTPKWSDYRLNLRVQGQWVQALSRSVGRREDFAKSTHLLTVSLDFDFIRPSVAQASGLFRPSVGVTYTDGSDPLTGRPDQSTIVMAFKLFFK